MSENRHYRNNRHFINNIQIYLLNHVHEFRFGRILSQRSHDGSKFLGGNGAWVSSSKKRAPLWAESWECQCATRPRRVTWQKANESIATRSLHNSPLSFNKTLYNRRVCALKKQSAFPCCARVSGRIVFGAVRYVDSGTNSTWKHCWIRANKWQAIFGHFPSNNSIFFYTHHRRPCQRGRMPLWIPQFALLSVDLPWSSSVCWKMWQG